MAHRSRLLLLGLFLLSGSAGLIHEIAWTRVLRHVLGGSSLALNSVLVAFLGGLALGAWLVARRIDRWRSPLALFGWVELLIAGWTVVLPVAVEATWPLWRALYGSTPGPGFVLARFVGALVLLAPAAVAMGASLPLLAAIEPAGSPRRARWVAWLYGLNALGAAGGALLAGFVLLPLFGLSTTIRSAAAVNLLVGIAALLLARGTRGVSAPPAPPPPEDRQRLLLGAYAVAGASLLVHEVAWARLATLLLGSTTYAYSLLLAVIVAGLACGGLIAARLVRTTESAWRSLATGQGLAAATGLVVIAIVPGLPPAITAWFATRPAADGAGLAVVAAVVGALFFVPCLLMGLAYPLVCRLVLGHDSAARPAARVQAIGNLGAVAGVCLAGFVLLPRLGLRNTLVVASALNALVAVSVAWSRRRPGRVPRAAFAFLIVWFVACAGLPEWKPSRISFGPFVQARRQPLEVATSTTALERVEAGQRVLFHRDGRESSMTVKETADGERSLWINGKPDASSVSDLGTQRLLAHVPLLLHPAPERVMILGVASGVTLRSAAAHPVAAIDAVDISDQAAEVAGWFEQVNRGVLRDPRVRLIVTDGRLHLTLTDERYDVIVSEPSNPWMAGIGDLYTAEFFARVGERLAPGGWFCLWLPAYHLDAASFRSVARTFVEAFPHAGLWHTQGSDYLLVGSADTPSIDPVNLETRLAGGEIRTELTALQIDDVADLFANRVLHGASLARFAHGAERHTDDNARLEFAAPRRLLSNPDEAGLLLAIESFRDPRPGFASDIGERLIRFNQARGAAIRASLLLSAGQGARAVKLLREAARANVADAYLERTLAANQAHADRMAAEGQREAALARYLLLLEIAPERAATREGLARLEQRF